MNQFTMQDLKRLAAVKSPMCISMYMPTSPDVSTVDEQRIRFKNLLRQARKTVQARAGSKKPLYDHIEAVQYRIEADNLWRYQSDGLAVFIAPEVLHYFRLPLKFDEKLWVADRFFVKPLIPLFMADGRFYILAISQSEIRLFDLQTNTVHLLPPDDPTAEDLLDRAAVETMQNGGRVYALPVSNMPENNSPVAAILRY